MNETEILELILLVAIVTFLVVCGVALLEAALNWLRRKEEIDDR